MVQENCFNGEIKNIKMEKKKPISLEEKKCIQLEMLKEIDAFCRNNNIRYSLAFGTLLGAVRHKGFIPWDDDVDIMMPLPDMLVFKDLFQSKNLKYCDVDTEKHYEYPFSRIVHLGTYNQKGLTFKDYGICIDLYPIVSIPSEKNQQDLYFSIAINKQKRRKQFETLRNRIIRHFPISSIPGYDAVQKKYRDHLLKECQPYGTTSCYYTVAGPLSIRKRTMYGHDIFEQLIDLEFEGDFFCCIKDYDYFLRLRYGDYMTPPPESERHPYHGGRYYWK